MQMTDGKTPVQADGGGKQHSAEEDSTGREGAGDSGGGAYPNPHTGKEPKSGGFLSHGGQTEIVEKKPGSQMKA
jgi:hypothetical protein